MSASTAEPTLGARERILAAAVERIASDGIDDVRIARIAMDAGVSTSLVHYHFETRDALLEQALEYSFELAGDGRIGDSDDEAPNQAMSFDPVRNQLPGLTQYPWVRRLREPSYKSARRSRRQ